MQHVDKFEPAGRATAADHGGSGHPGLVRFDAVRRLLVETGLTPEPETYEVFYLYVSEMDPALSREVERALESGHISISTIRAIRTSYLGDIAAGELLELVEEAHGSATDLVDSLAEGTAELVAFDAVLNAEDTLLGKDCNQADLIHIITRLRAANRRMMRANNQLESEILAVTSQAGDLLNRLKKAENSASTDALTGLPNKRGFAKTLKRAHAIADVENRPLSIGLIDIDHFAELNRKWGVDIGDEVLRCVAAHLRATAQAAGGDNAFAARLGSDEFAVVLPGIDLKRAVAIVEDARAVLARQMLRRADDGTNLGRITFSAGIAQYRSGESPDSHLDRADAALFRAKRVGRDRVLPEKSAATGV